MASSQPTMGRASASLKVLRWRARLSGKVIVEMMNLTVKLRIELIVYRTRSSTRRMRPSRLFCRRRMSETLMMTSHLILTWKSMIASWLSQRMASACLMDLTSLERLNKLPQREILWT